MRKPAAEVLAEWILAHPNQTFDPLGPTKPANPLTAFVAFVQQLVKQFNQSTRLFVNAVVTAITNFLGSFTRPAVANAAPLSQRVALSTSPDGQSAAQAGETAKGGAKIQLGATDAAGADAAVHPTVITESAAPKPTADAKPSAVEPSLVAEPSVTEPTVSEPISTTPEVEVPATGDLGVPESTPAVTATESTNDSTTSSASTDDAPGSHERPERAARDKAPSAAASPAAPSRSTTVQSNAREDRSAKPEGAASASPASSGSAD